MEYYQDYAISEGFKFLFDSSLSLPIDSDKPPLEPPILELIKRMLKFMGLSNTEIANATGVEEKELDEILRGEKRASLETIAKILSLLGVSDQIIISRYEENDNSFQKVEGVYLSLLEYVYKLVGEQSKIYTQELVQKVMQELIALPYTLSGDDSHLKNVWEEICVQVQDEMSFYWNAYEDTIDNVITAEYEALPVMKQNFIKIETLSNHNSYYEDMEGFRDISLNDISEYIKGLVLGEADDFSNSRIEKYIAQKVEDYEEEDYEEDEENVDEEQEEDKIHLTEKPSRFFSETEAEKLAQNLFTFWAKGIAMRWFYLAFQALEKSGLTYFETEEEEMKVRERIVLLAVYYHEFCYQSNYHQSPFFIFWDQATIQKIKSDLNYNETELRNIHQALNRYWGSEMKIFAELWVNCQEGAQNRVKQLADSTYLYNGIVSENAQQHFNMERGLNWIISRECILENYEAFRI